MQDTLIDQGLNLMLYGMGTVFVFLTLLVFATTLMSRLVTRWAPEPSKNETPVLADASPSGNVDATTLQVIKKAIAAHRKKRG